MSVINAVGPTMPDMMPQALVDRHFFEPMSNDQLLGDLSDFDDFLQSWRESSTRAPTPVSSGSEDISAENLHQDPSKKRNIFTPNQETPSEVAVPNLSSPSTIETGSTTTFPERSCPTSGVSTSCGSVKKRGPVKTTAKKARVAASRKLRTPPRGQGQALVYTTKRPCDILYGRGGEGNLHPGNQHYRRVIEAKKKHYRALRSKNEKTDFSRELVHQFKEEGRRFLEKETKTNQWYVVHDEVSKRKVGQKLRDAISASQS